MRCILQLLIVSLLMSGCAHVVSEDMRARADQGVSISLLFDNPEYYKGKTVILGGTIASSRNTREGTYIEVVEKNLDYRGRPKYSDKSQGRFIVLNDGFLDTAIFSPGRHVTVAGEVMGKMVRPLGEMDYTFLFIKSREIHIVNPKERLPVHIGIGIHHTF